MGLFGVNVPPLYGEGQKAFLRLQLEILGISDDESIFAWTLAAVEKSGLLVHSVGAFGKLGNILQSNFARHRAPYSMTNKRLRIKALLDPTHTYGASTNSGIPKSFLVPLNCRREGDFRSLSVHVLKIYRDQFLKIRPEILTALNLPDNISQQIDQYQDIYVKQQEVSSDTHTHVFSINLSSPNTYSLPVYAKRPDSDTYWRPGEDGDKILLVLQTSSKPPRGVLVCQQTEARLNKSTQFPDEFALVISIAGSHPGIDVICPPANTPSIDLRWAKARQGDRRFLDKISKELLSGTSVSVVLRKGGRSPDIGIQKHLVNVTVGPEGSIPWPDPDHDMTSTESWHPKLDIANRWAEYPESNPGVGFPITDRKR